MKRLFLAVLLLLILCLPAQSAVKKIAVILFNFQDNTFEPYTTAAMKGVVFTNASSVNALYTEMSFGTLTIEGSVAPTGDVYGWYTVPYLSTDCLALRAVMESNARTQAVGDGFVFADYDVIIYGFNPGSSCGGIGAEAGSPGAVHIPLVSLPGFGLVAHELGHAFGRSHSNGWDCVNASGAPVAISSNCTVVPYGNVFDTMGQSGLQGHFNVFEKANAYTTTWLVPGNVTSVTATGDYTIYPLETNTSNPMALKISRGNGQYLWVEFRKTFGFDSYSPIALRPGVLIYVAGNTGDTGESFLLDTTPTVNTPGSVSQFDDAALTQGNTFTDSAQGLTIAATTINGTTSATLHVAFSGSACTSKPPTVGITPNTQTGMHGDTLTYTVIVTNPNTVACGSSTYSVIPKVPAGWTVSPASRTEALAAGASVSRSFTVTSKPSARAGTYAITQKATNSTNKRLSASAATTYIVNAP